LKLLHLNMNRKSMKLIQFETFFQNLSMFGIRFGVGAASCCGSTEMMQLLAALAPQRCILTH
jgi:hypothetical protein